jgi:hypothetical protein
MIFLSSPLDSFMNDLVNPDQFNSIQIEPTAAATVRPSTPTQKTQRTLNFGSSPLPKETIAPIAPKAPEMTMSSNIIGQDPEPSSKQAPLTSAPAPKPTSKSAENPATLVPVVAEQQQNKKKEKEIEEEEMVDINEEAKIFELKKIAEIEGISIASLDIEAIDACGVMPIQKNEEGIYQQVLDEKKLVNLGQNLLILYGLPQAEMEAFLRSKSRVANEGEDGEESSGEKKKKRSSSSSSKKTKGSSDMLLESFRHSFPVRLSYKNISRPCDPYFQGDSSLPQIDRLDVIVWGSDLLRIFYEFLDETSPAKAVIGKFFDGKSSQSKQIETLDTFLSPDTFKTKQWNNDLVKQVSDKRIKKDSSKSVNTQAADVRALVNDVYEAIGIQNTVWITYCRYVLNSLAAASQTFTKASQSLQKTSKQFEKVKNEYAFLKTPHYLLPMSPTTFLVEFLMFMTKSEHWVFAPLNFNLNEEVNGKKITMIKDSSPIKLCSLFFQFCNWIAPTKKTTKSGKSKNTIGYWKPVGPDSPCEIKFQSYMGIISSPWLWDKHLGDKVPKDKLPQDTAQIFWHVEFSNFEQKITYMLIYCAGQHLLKDLYQKKNSDGTPDKNAIAQFKQTFGEIQQLREGFKLEFIFLTNEEFNRYYDQITTGGIKKDAKDKKNLASQIPAPKNGISMDAHLGVARYAIMDLCINGRAPIPSKEMPLTDLEKKGMSVEEFKAIIIPPEDAHFNNLQCFARTTDGHVFYKSTEIPLPKGNQSQKATYVEGGPKKKTPTYYNLSTELGIAHFNSEKIDGIDFEEARTQQRPSEGVCEHVLKYVLGTIIHAGTDIVVDPLASRLSRVIYNSNIPHKSSTTSSSSKSKPTEKKTKKSSKSKEEESGEENDDEEEEEDIYATDYETAYVKQKRLKFVEEPEDQSSAAEESEKEEEEEEEETPAPKRTKAAPPKPKKNFVVTKGKPSKMEEDEEDEEEEEERPKKIISKPKPVHKTVVVDRGQKRKTLVHSSSDQQHKPASRQQVVKKRAPVTTRYQEEEVEEEESQEVAEDEEEVNMNPTQIKQLKQLLSMLSAAPRR